VGLDYHTTSVQLCILDSQGRVLANRPCPNDSGALADRVRPPSDRVHAAIEACTGAADLAQELVA
jgi:hypothetical protein